LFFYSNSGKSADFWLSINPTPDPSPEKEGDIECAASPLLFRGGVGGGVDRREDEVEPNQAA